MSTPSEQEWEGATLDVEALRPKPCGCCDGGLLMACTCRDYRNDLDRALDEVERLRTQIERERQQARQEALTEAAEILEHFNDRSLELLGTSKVWHWRWRRFREEFGHAPDSARYADHYFKRAATVVRSRLAAAGGVS